MMGGEVKILVRAEAQRRREEEHFSPFGWLFATAAQDKLARWARRRGAESSGRKDTVLRLRKFFLFSIQQQEGGFASKKVTQLPRISLREPFRYWTLITLNPRAASIADSPSLPAMCAAPTATNTRSPRFMRPVS